MKREKSGGFQRGFGGALAGLADGLDVGSRGQRRIKNDFCTFGSSNSVDGDAVY